MSVHTHAILSLSVMAALVIGPAVLCALLVRFLDGWRLRVAFPLLTIGLMTLPTLWLGPQIHRANGVSPDYGSYICLGIVMFTAVILISALIGFGVGAFWLHLHRRSRDEGSGAMFWQRL